MTYPNLKWKYSKVRIGNKTYFGWKNLILKNH